MNRFFSIALATAVVPALYLAYAQLTHSPDTELIAVILFRLAMPLAAVLFLVGVVGISIERGKKSQTIVAKVLRTGIAETGQATVRNMTFWRILISVAITYPLFRTFLKTTSIRPGEQAFVFIVNALWFLAVSATIYVVTSLLRAQLTPTLIAKKVSIVLVLLVPVLFLNMCSYAMTSWHWGG